MGTLRQIVQAMAGFVDMTVAQANKTARIAWALLKHGGTYQKPEMAEAA